MARSSINDLARVIRPGLAAVAAGYGARGMVKPKWSITIAPAHVALMFGGRTEALLYDPVTLTYDDDDLIATVLMLTPGRMKEWDRACFEPQT